MIGKLTGVIDLIEEEYCIIDVGGVGYRVFCSSRLLADFTPQSALVSLLIETQVREDMIRLYGFASLEEKSWFNRLQNVQGIGAKLAIAILGAFSITDLIGFIADKNITSLCRAPGVGKKVAERIVTELHKFAQLHNVPGSLPPDLPANNDTELRSAAISALQNLGYSSEMAGKMVNNILVELDATVPQNNASLDETLKKVIRLALKNSSAF